MTTSPILLLDNVSRVHGHDETAVRALDGVTLEVYAGELVAVMGPSGSGKSTLLNLAGGLDQPTSGRVVVEGSDVGAMSLRDLAAHRGRHSVAHINRALCSLIHMIVDTRDQGP